MAFQKWKETLTIELYETQEFQVSTILIIYTINIYYALNFPWFRRDNNYILKQIRYLLDLWQQGVDSNKSTLNEFKDLVIGRSQDLELDDENLTNWVLLENKINREFEKSETDGTSDGPQNCRLGGKDIYTVWSPYHYQ